MPGWPGPAPASSAIAAAFSWPPSRQVWASRGPAAPVRYSRVLLAVEQSNSNLWACDQAKRLPPLDKRLGSWARGEQDSDGAHLAQERLAGPGAGRRNVDRPRASWPPGRERLHDEFLYPCRVDRGEVDHAQQLTPRPGDGPCHVGGRRRGHDVGEGGGIAQRA